MTVLERILAWSATAPDWQRDALRRIVRHRALSTDDAAELTELCKRPYGLSNTETNAQPLSAEDVPADEHLVRAVLKSVRHVADVNALEKGQVLTFQAEGLTVVYGDNGAGKSSYARILKRACRARGSGDAVLANVLSELPAGRPTAEITFDVGGSEQKHVWQDGEVSARELASISVFDSASAQVYIADKTEVAFRPFGLDVLDKLAAACAEVRSRLEKEKAVLGVQAPAWPALPEGSAAARFLKSISALTAPDEVERICSLSEAERDELERTRILVAAARSDDAVRRSQELKIQAARARKLKDHVIRVRDALNDEAVGRVEKLRRSADEAESAAATARQLFDRGSHLSGVGGGAWRRLWEAARAYSQGDAYAGEPFPCTKHGARCVLCQQELSADAPDRLRTFEEFVQGRVQQDATQAVEALDRSVNAIAQLRIDAEQHVVDELRLSAPEIATKVTGFLGAASASRETLLAAVRTRAGNVAKLEEPAPVGDLDTLAAELERRANDLVLAADPATRRVAEARLAELDARAKLVALKPTILAEVARLARMNAYDRALKDTTTAAVTRQSTELTKTYVTDALATGFAAELKKFGFDRPELVLKPVGGQKGALYHQVQLAQVTRAQLGKILSEGEARCLALAAFLAEVRSGGNSAGIVFDDPVSSLDHKWRSRMADRLVAEAKERQVIVFTHELVFLYEIMQAADGQGVVCTGRTVRRTLDRVGRVDPDLPWEAQSTQKRIGVLRQALQNARTVLKEQGEDAYEDRAIRLYARLRRTWERAIEEVLLNGAVERFRDSVQTQKLKKVELASTDYDTIEAGMAKCSKWEGGHDHALAMNEPLPRPDEIEADVDMLDTFVKQVEKRRKK